MYASAASSVTVFQSRDQSFIDARGATVMLLLHDTLFDEPRGLFVFQLNVEVAM